jgi:histidyl-tRNA synthetase
MIGEKELNEGKISIKDMKTGEQKLIDLGELSNI